MSDKPAYLSDIITEKGAQTLLEGYTDFADEAFLSDDEQQRILSSAMRKAGSEMKETMLTKKKRKHSKRFAGIVLAAAVALTGAIGAAAYYSFINSNSVEHFIDNADTLEEKGFAENQVMENGHIRITIDTVLSDGYNGYIIYTTEALDETGEELRDRYLFDKKFYYSGSSEQVRFKQSYTGARFPVEENGKEREYQMIDLTDVDVSESFDIRFYALDMYSGESVELDEYGLPADNLLDGMTAAVNFEKNCDIVSLTDEKGSKVILSQFEVLYDDISVNDTIAEQMKLIRADGTKEAIDKDKMYFSEGTVSKGNGLSEIIFGRFIELDDYKGIELDGREYTK